jgi:hypothetical protein
VAGEPSKKVQRAIVVPVDESKRQSVQWNELDWPYPVESGKLDRRGGQIRARIRGLLAVSGRQSRKRNRARAGPVLCYPGWTL